jgi:hypothetical protein
MINGSGLTRSSTMIPKTGILKATGVMTIGVMTIGVMTTQTPAVVAHVLTPIPMTTPGNPQSLKVDARTLATRRVMKAAENGAKTLACGLVDCGWSRTKTTEEPERNGAPITMTMMIQHLTATQNTRSTQNGVHIVIHSAAPSVECMISIQTCATGASTATSSVYANMLLKTQ